METGIHNTSEIGRLRKVMLHRPGMELENLMPEYLEQLLFDDIPYLREAQREHDAFADCLRSEVLPSVRLTEIFRQAQKSLIVTNAHAINNGEMPNLSVKDNDFFFLPRKSDAERSQSLFGSERYLRNVISSPRARSVSIKSRSAEKYASTSGASFLLSDPAKLKNYPFPITEDSMVSMAN